MNNEVYGIPIQRQVGVKGIWVLHGLGNIQFLAQAQAGSRAESKPHWTTSTTNSSLWPPPFHSGWSKLNQPSETASERKLNIKETEERKWGRGHW